MNAAGLHGLTGVLISVLCTAAAIAHPVVPTVVLVQVTREDGVARVHAIVTHDALAYALNDTSARVTDPQMYDLLAASREDLAAALQDGRERFAAAFRILADGSRVETTLVESPTVESIELWKRDNPSGRLPVTLDFVVDATLPAGTGDILIELPIILGDAILTVDRPGAEPVYLPVFAGEDSPAIDVRAAAAPRTPGVVRVGLRYVRFGYEHIIPYGWDHALFVLGLFLLSPRFKDLFWLITTFTVAHTVTLTLATLHLVTVPSSIVEPTIAATIAFVGIENLFATRVHLWRPVVAFVFGLVHGLGFASALIDVGLPAGQLATGIVAFSIGVEAGHVTVLLAAFALLGWMRGKPWYRRRVAIPLSACIAAVGLVWMAQRLF